jgi:cyclohexanone monooxygenase
MKRNVRTIEPTEKAEKEWVATIEQLASLRAAFLKECTPGYYNNEGSASKTGARNASYGGGSPAFLKILEDWRATGEMEGLEMQYFEK